MLSSIVLKIGRIVQADRHLQWTMNRLKLEANPSPSRGHSRRRTRNFSDLSLAMQLVACQTMKPSFLDHRKRRQSIFYLEWISRDD